MTSTAKQASADRQPANGTTAGEATGDRNPAISITFSVDSALLRELGERLVGQPHIALAELIKNAYDADATIVTIEFSRDEIVITDNGHGMDFTAFRDRWMRVGTPGKQSDRWSPKFGRPLTGSKGVGRLSVQFLASQLELRTVSDINTQQELMALIDWGSAVQAGELTKATALYDIYTAAPPFDGDHPGTRIALSRLNQQWSAERFEELAKEIWPLQPPFWAPDERRTQALTTRESEFRDLFVVRLASPTEPDIVRRFDQQMQRILDIFQARIMGRLSRDSDGPTVDVALVFNDGERFTARFRPDHDHLARADFEIRVFDLHHRQQFGIKVEDARDYVRKNGGVHVYDAGFHLPYYGPDTDWLGIDADHAARRSRSQLLPQDLQVEGGMEYLPPNSRMFGVVNVDTSYERNNGTGSLAERLAIQVSRDRLVSNAAYRELATIVRWALDFYATRQTTRQFAQRLRSRPTAAPASATVEAILRSVEGKLDEPLIDQLRTGIKAVIDEAKLESATLEAHAGLLGALATAGMAALALEHEVSKQFSLLEELASRLRGGQVDDLPGAGVELGAWIERARASQRLFSHLVSQSQREERERYPVRTVVQSVVEQTRPLMRGIEMRTTELQPEVLLPSGLFSEWAAILQNALFNAHDATLDSEDRIVRFRTRVGPIGTALLIEDTGVGVTLEESDKLFDPFVQALEVSPGRRTLRIGTSGLGLTIVRMIAQSLNCRCRFVRSSEGYSTALELSWTEL